MLSHFAEPMEDRELLRHIIDGRLEGERISAAESITPVAAPAVKPSQHLESMPVCHTAFAADVLLSEKRHFSWWTQQTKCARKIPGEFVGSRFEGTAFASGTTDLSPGNVNVWVICDWEDPDFGQSVDLHGQSCSLGITV